MITLFLWSLIFFSSSLFFLNEIRKCTNQLSFNNFINVSKYVFFQFVLTSFYLLNVGDEPTNNQTFFIVFCFFSALIFLIVNSLKSGDILSLLFGIMVVLFFTLLILWLCFSIVSYHKISNMIKALSIFLIFISIAFMLYNIVPNHKLLYMITILVMGAIGTILLFSAYLYPEEVSYRNIHNTIYNWGKIKIYSEPDDAVYMIQKVLLTIFILIVPMIVGFIINKKLEKLSNKKSRNTK